MHTLPLLQCVLFQSHAKEVGEFHGGAGHAREGGCYSFGFLQNPFEIELPPARFILG